MGKVILLSGAGAQNGPPTPVRCVATITTVAAANLVDGERLLVNDGKKIQIFEFDKNGAISAMNGIRVDVAAALTADQVRDLLITLINGAGLDVVAISGGAATVTITHNRAGANLIQLTESVVNVGFVIAITTAGALPGVSLAGLALSSNSDPRALAMVLVRNSAGTGALTAKVRLWVYSQEDPVDYYPLGIGPLADANLGRGVLNGGQVIGVIAANKLNHTEIVEGLIHFSHAYAEIVDAPGGVAPAFDVELVSAV